MAQPFRVESRDITSLDDVQLTKLLKLLLHLEARSAGIAQRAVDVALNIRVSDGGEDGRIEWQGGPPSTNFIPHRLTQFQNKATDMGPTKCAAELVASDGSVKPMVDAVLSAGGAYVLFTTQEQNSKQKTNNIAAMREKLGELKKPYAQTANIQIYDASKIEGWVNRYLSAIVAVLNWVGRPLERGLKTWTDWGQHPEYQSFPFVPDPERANAITSLRALLSEPRKSARCIGLSGLGKTRLAYEVFRDHAPTDDMSKRVVYIDSAANPILAGLVTDWIQCGIEGVLVVDNCEISLHERLAREVQRADSKLSVLTLDYNMDRPSQTTEIVHVKPMADEYIKQMLSPVYADKISDLDRIVAFAQGYPQMAVLLANSRLENEPEMGSLTDDDLARKLLWGGGDRDESAEKILRGCALFDKFGLDGEAMAEYAFIAESVVGVNVDSFYECVKRFEERGLIDRRGRYAKVVPKPLAIRLAAEWWRTSRPQKQKELIEADMPEELVTSFCDQISRLDFLPEVKALAEKLCGVSGPFGQAEVILSERGSRLFRAFVEVNPGATSHALANVLHPMNREALLAIQGDVRRNLVWALEKLCFHRNCFLESGWSLLMLASAENESWSNNASGHFKQLFRTFLSGTEATPQDRLQLLDHALEDARSEVRIHAVHALEKAINNHGGSRVVGAEYQGSRVPLQEWKPRIWQEAFDYWSNALRRLVTLVKSKDEYAAQAKDAIAANIRGLMLYGRVDDLDDAIRTIVTVDGPLWPHAVDSINTTLAYDAEKMPSVGQEKLREWMALLTPSDIADRLVLYVTNAPYEHKQNSSGEFVDVAAENAEALARDLASDLATLIPHLSSLFVGSQRQAYVFGRSLIQHAESWEPLLKKSLEIVCSIKEPNTSFLLGLLNGIFRKEKPRWLSIVQEFADSDALVEHFATAITTGEPNEKHLDKLVELIKFGKVRAAEAGVLSYGRAIDHLTTTVVSKFVLDLADISPEAGWIGLHILSMYCHGQPERRREASTTFKSILLRLPLESDVKKQQLSMHDWETAAKQILKSEDDKEFAVALAENILKASIKDLDYGDLEHSVKPILRMLFNKFGRMTWPIFADAIKNADALQEYHLTQLLSSENGFEKKSPSVLAELPDDLLRDWCASEPELAPPFVAKATEVLDETNGEYSISARAKFLIDAFGDNEHVLSSLSANLSTFGWTGSLVPYFERELAAITKILDHPKVKVREWARRRVSYLQEMIEREKRRDQEGDWGLY